LGEKIILQEARMITVITDGYLDSHCHLQTGSNIEKTGKSGVTGMFCNATCEKDWQAVIDLAAREQRVIPFLGIHPWFMEDVAADWEERLLKLLKQTPAGIGEIGLDKCCRTDFSRQEQMFQTQLRMASELKRPVTIHCVQAWGRLLEILQKQAKPLPKMMIHSFSGSIEMLLRLIHLGCFISFSPGLITNSRLQSSFLKTPLTSLLLETDAPGRAGKHQRSSANDQSLDCSAPAGIIGLYQWAAEIRGMSLDQFRQQIWKNGEIFTHSIVSW
jgi:TatD DNase family protein